MNIDGQWIQYAFKICKNKKLYRFQDILLPDLARCSRLVPDIEVPCEHLCVGVVQPAPLFSKNLVQQVEKECLLDPWPHPPPAGSPTPLAGC